MTNHFFAIDPQGKAHTRSSKGRAYTHTVVARLGRAEVERRFVEIEPAGVRAGESYDRVVNESQGNFPNREQWRGPGVLANWTAFAIKYLAEDAIYSKGRDYVIADAIARARKNAEDYEAGKEWDLYLNAGWCSRRDLAQKLASSQVGEQVLILEAQVGKPPKK